MKTNSSRNRVQGKTANITGDQTTFQPTKQLLSGNQAELCYKVLNGKLNF